MGIMIRNKVRLVAQGYTQEEDIDYDKVFAPVARIKAIRLFLSYASFKDFVVYQMDVKSTFLYGKIEEEVLTEVKTTSTPMETQKPLLKDQDGKEVDVHTYRLMIGSLMYLTSSRPDIMFAVCACARYKVNPKVSHLHAVKRIFRYLKGQPKLCLWYLKDFTFDLVAYTDSDYAGASLDIKSTTGGCQFLRCRLISWQCKKQTVVANFTIEAEYFWSTAMAKTNNVEVQIHARVDGKEIVITESSVRRHLQLADEEGIECLPNSTIFEQLALMGKPKRKDTQVPQPSGPTNNVANEAILKELGDRLVRAATTAYSLEVEQDNGGGPRCQETMKDTTTQTRVLDLEKTKTTQRNEIDSLKRRVKKLEKRNRSRIHTLKRLYKVGLSAMVESSGDEESLGKDASKQGRRIDAIDVDKDISLVNDADNEMFDVDDLGGEEVFLVGKNENVVKEIVDAAQVSTVATNVTITTKEITLAQAHEALKTKGKGIVFQEPCKSTTTTTTIISSQQSQDKGKGIMIEEPMKPKKKDQIRLDEEAALKLQAERRARTRITKKQKVEDDKEKVKLKQLIETIPDEEEVSIDDILLDVKSPRIVDWKIHKEGKKSYYQIVRADGKSQMYMIFSQMLKSFDKEDLEDLYKVVKARYGSTRPVESMDYLLWSDMKTMFEPHVEDEIWKMQQGYKVLEWKLYNSCRVHSLMMQSMQIYLLVEKKYPLTPPILFMMLEKKHQIHYESEMAYQLLDEDEDSEKEEFKEEEEPQEYEDADIHDEEDENKPELKFPYEEADPLKPLLPAFRSKPEDVIEVEDTVESEDEIVPASVHEVGESSIVIFLRENGDSLLHSFMRRDIDSLFEGVAAMENLVRKLGNAEKELSEVIRRGVVFEERPNEDIDAPVKDEKSPIMPPKSTPLTQAAIRRMIKESVDTTITAERARQANAENNASGSGQARGQVTTHVVRECTFAGFMRCNPDNFHGTKGAAELRRWFEKTKMNFGISEYAEDKKVKFVAATLRGPALTWWNSKVVILGLDVANQIGWSEMKKLMTVEFCPAEEV
nr:ribonuclease H-like domain, reverse transcriptase, RNA-dependent DNA polymerase [Tanacetum cinerariifolium]